ncbi:hypothetical protein DRQ15_01105 [candidate division KSB1 bacterium]|nr:PAS domain S-box protein [bacterium]RKY77201.1 MAG: hypothetical protein DRQ12_08695 [candidate division KSB1 bacterium]RKY86463.1 MAG: hypothetical protein DRP98_00330 [candidate division KSB1 bacterium]RKY92856.1 MAG: hypothetical protein DRQ15_01105 [candidate division KSB1 bacterium]
MKKQKKKILLIDDDPSMLDIGRIIIKKAGMEYLEADSPEAGFEKILAEKPDLILLDYMMPRINGDEFFETFITDPRFEKVNHIPVIMLTARDDDGIDQRALFKKGLSAFLIKPFGHRELVNVIENVLQMAEIRNHNLQLQEEIRRTKYRYRDLIENANDLIFTLDEQGQLIFVNNRISILTHYSRKDWLEKYFVDLVHKDDRHLVLEAWEQCKTGKSNVIEIRIPDKDGQWIYFSTNLTPLFEDDKVVGAVGIARDITEKKKLEQQLIDLKNFTESIIQSMNSGLITVDMERRITYFNSGAEEILGYRAEEVINKSLDEIFPKTESEQLLPTNSRANTLLLNREMEITTKNGEKAHIGFSNTPWKNNFNHKVGTIITFRDISEIKRLQIEMIRMDRLASLGVLASGIAHEIRNPLAGIKTMVQTLEEEIDSDDPHGEYLQRIIRQVNRLDELLKAFFSYARPRPPLKKQHHLPDIVREVITLLHKRIAACQVELEENYAKHLPPVLVDLNQIQQVFFNLIINALDSMPEGGKLQIKARPVSTKLQTFDRRKRGYRVRDKVSTFVEVKLADSGVGIRPEHLETIFDPFFTTKSQGTGLGLSIVYRIIQEHGGEIRVESELGKGSVFTLLLPTEE